MSKDILGFSLDKQWDYENGFYLTSHLTRIAKLLAHYELYKSISHLPGHIVECGVYKGASLIRFGTFREICESPFSRKIIGFDAFGKFPKHDDAADPTFRERFEELGGDGISVEDLTTLLSQKSFQNVELIQGDILTTVPKYVAAHPELKIALLHVDVDVYKPSVTILDNLVDRVVKGGLVLFDDYGTVAGETRAIDEYFAGRSLVIEKLSISHIPAFVRIT
jgi:hypothetical protein